MKSPNRHRRIVILIFAMLVLASGIAMVVFSAKRLRRKPSQEPLPPIISKVKDLEGINPRFVNLNTDAEGIAFEVFNKSPRAVMAIRIRSGDAGLAKDGLRDEEHPLVVIDPYGSLPVEITNLTRGKPIVITAATFQDGKEEGEDSSLEFMKKSREHFRKEKERAAKEGSKQ